MLFKPFLIEKIAAGQKTQTRRLVKDGDMAIDTQGNPGATDSPFFNLMGDIDQVLNANGRLRFAVGEEYAVCPGRGKPTMRYGLLPMLTPIPANKTNDDRIVIRITAIRRQDVRDIAYADARAEGFEDRESFLATWEAINGKHFDAWALTFEIA